MKKTSLLFVFMLLLSSFVSAGVGIVWDRESSLVNEGENTCLSYGVYNPWPEDSTVEIGISDELSEILITQEAESKFVPANTLNDAAIPIQFCFKTPQVYEKDCWIGNTFICEQQCGEEQKVYSGEVIISSSNKATITGSGGSSTKLSVSAPLRINVRCNPSSRDYSLIYIILAAVSLIVIIALLIRRKGQHGNTELQQNKGMQNNELRAKNTNVRNVRRTNRK